MCERRVFKHPIQPPISPTESKKPPPPARTHSLEQLLDEIARSRHPVLVVLRMRRVGLILGLGLALLLLWGLGLGVILVGAGAGGGAVVVVVVVAIMHLGGHALALDGGGVFP
jgi:hypothetical protein